MRNTNGLKLKFNNIWKLSDVNDFLFFFDKELTQKTAKWYMLKEQG